MFSNAKVIPSKKAATKKTKEQLEIPGLEALAILKAMSDAITALSKSIEADVKAKGLKVFMERRGGKRPSSFEGVDGVATCSVEVRKRGTNSALNDEEVAALEKCGITVAEQVTVQKLFAINPVYANDATLLGKVEKALGKIVPEDFIVVQEEVSKKVVSEEMLDAAFLADRKKVPDAVVSMLVTMALKPKLDEEYDKDDLIADVTRIMSGE